MKHAVLLAALATALSSCATAPSRIEAANVSPSAYDAYDCSQLNAELVRVQGRLQTVVQMQGKQSDHDKLMAGALVLSPLVATGMLVFGQDLKQEVSQMKGEFLALTEAARQKNCRT